MVNITVHHFSVDLTPPSSNHILETARRLVDAATSETSSHWRSLIPIPSAAILSNRTVTGACFVWGRSIPVIDRTTNVAREKRELKDWDIAIEDPLDMTDFKSLPEFEVTDFGDIISHPKSRFTSYSPKTDSPPNDRSRFANDVGLNSDTSPRKRFCSEFERFSHPTIPISKLIPFPHYYESPDPALPPPQEIDKIPAFRISRSFLPSALLMKPFARSAWLVPLRGVPPVEGASAAHLDNTPTHDPLPPSGTLPRTIQWTSAAVTYFWKFLLRQRSTNNFGPMALAYLCSPPLIQKARLEHERKAKRSNELDDVDFHKGKQGKQEQRNNNRECPIDEDGNETADAMAWEYIKIYHDSQYAMKLRSLLDSFRWEDDTNGAIGKTIVGGAQPFQYRVLKATRLVLVDETGDAILLA